MKFGVDVFGISSGINNRAVGRHGKGAPQFACEGAFGASFPHRH